MIKIASKWITVSDCRSSPNEYFIFGDNLQGWGKGGQAVIRDEPNAIGIPTKISPYLYMSDTIDNAKAVIKSLEYVKTILDSGYTVWYPCDGIGTGRAKLKEKAPKIYAGINAYINKLIEVYGDGC